MHHALSRLDRSLLEWLHRHSTPAGLTFFLLISRLGSPEAMTALAVIGGVFLVLRREGILLAGGVQAFIGTIVIDNSLNLTLHRAPQIYASAILRHPTWS